MSIRIRRTRTESPNGLRTTGRRCIPYGDGGGYVNFMMEGEGEDRIRATYRDSYDKLARIKAKYDPNNFFRVNQNIRPEASAKIAV